MNLLKQYVINYKISILNFYKIIKLNPIKYIFSGLLGAIIGSGIYYWSHISFGIKATVNIHYNSIEELQLVTNNLLESNFFLATNLINCNSGIAERSENIQFDGLTKSALSGLRIFKDTTRYSTRLEYRAINKFDAESCLSEIIKNLKNYDAMYVDKITEDFYLGRASLLNSIKEYKYVYKIISNKLISFTTNKINEYDYATLAVTYSTVAAGLEELRAKEILLNQKIDLHAKKYMIISPIELKGSNELKIIVFPLLGLLIGIFTCFRILKKH